MNHSLKLLYGPDEICTSIDRVAAEIKKTYGDTQPLLCVCVLRGAVMFFTELVKRLGHNVEFDFLTLSSYESAHTTGTVKLIQAPSKEMKDKNILIIEDIVDSGNTVRFLRNFFKQNYGADVRIACLLDKPCSRQVNESADFTALTLATDAFVVGYGMDYNQKYRNLDGIYEIS